LCGWADVRWLSSHALARNGAKMLDLLHVSSLPSVVALWRLYRLRVQLRCWDSSSWLLIACVVLGVSHRAAPGHSPSVVLEHAIAHAGATDRNCGHFRSCAVQTVLTAPRFGDLERLRLMLTNSAGRRSFTSLVCVEFAVLGGLLCASVLVGLLSLCSCSHRAACDVRGSARACARDGRIGQLLGHP
jgi:hypothetical protein